MNLPLHLLTLSFRFDETPIFSASMPTYPDLEQGAVYATLLRTVPALPAPFVSNHVQPTVLCMTKLGNQWQQIILDAYSKQVLNNALTTHHAKLNTWVYFYLERGGCYFTSGEIV